MSRWVLRVIISWWARQLWTGVVDLSTLFGNWTESLCRFIGLGLFLAPVDVQLSPRSSPSFPSCPTSERRRAETVWKRCDTCLQRGISSENSTYVSRDTKLTLSTDDATQRSGEPTDAPVLWCSVMFSRRQMKWRAAILFWNHSGQKCAAFTRWDDLRRSNKRNISADTQTQRTRTSRGFWFLSALFVLSSRRFSFQNATNPFIRTPKGSESSELVSNTDCSNVLMAAVDWLIDFGRHISFWNETSNRKH